MKKVVLAIVILIIIVTGGILEDFYIHKTFSALNEKLTSLENSIINQSEDCLDKANDIFEWWEKKRTYMELFAYSPDVRSFSVALAETQGSLECEDYQNALSKCRSLIVMADNIKRLLDFNAEDII
ncbi:MAG TPA: hypothetical protein DEF02_03400 [Clostridiales bacterium]|nr:hypothetical protein [Clostridiales bacterium]HBP51826.1 hypothetical protein [Clostridiales bacterium]HBW05615.1 hypothetical protein [Clostridiales bacterium]HCH92590.1 hypothetical protein [Clostridiales bacterium]